MMLRPIPPPPCRKRFCLREFVGAVVVALSSTIMGAAPAAGQQPSVDAVHPPVDRRLSRGIERARTSIAAGEYSQAILFLDEVLGRENDYFVENRTEGALVGLKDAARKMIRDLPADARASYAAAYGPVAKRLCEAAIKRGDAAALQAVVERYFYTPAGYQAAMALAREEADAGRRLSAALLYEQLLEAPEAVALYDPQLSLSAAASWMAAGDETRAAEVLAKVAERGKQPVTIAGRKFVIDGGLAPPDAAREWLAEHLDAPLSVGVPLERQWVTFRGNAARNGESDGGLPHMRVRWRVRLIGFAKLARVFEDFAVDMRESGKPAPPAAAPLAVGDLVLVQTPQNLLAVDFRTGKMVWRTEPQREPQIEQLIASRTGPNDAGNDAEPARSFARRVWEDHLYSSIASDGERAFTIRDLGIPTMPNWEPWQAPFGVPEGRGGASDANRLCAYDLATQGKLVWEIDGATAEDELRGAFFLGAPVAAGNALFVLAEVKNRIYLVALDAATGDVDWLQQLVDVEVRVTANLRRRLQASMPSYESGMLVCPTGAGIVVGVDAARRSLAWAYRYQGDDMSAQAIYDGAAQAGEVGPTSKWTDAGATIVDGRVLLTPPESNELHCLDLRTGELLWARPRGDMFQLACVDDGRILLVAPHSLMARNLSDGDSAWPGALEFDEDAQPSGSGFLSDGRFYLPMSNGEVIAVDTSSAKEVARVTSPDAMPLGNLICHRGAVISAGGLFLDRFDQIDVLRRRAQRLIAKNPNDAEALRTMGEVAYNDGRLSEAVDLLERAYAIDRTSAATREVLAECLATAIEQDFGAYRQRLPLLKELNGDSESSRTSFLRIEAEGLLAAGEPLASADVCLTMFERSRRLDEPLAIGQHQDTTVGRWLAAQFAAIWDKADEQVRGKLQKRLDGLVRVAAVSQADERQRLVEVFGDLPPLERSKLVHAAELVQEGQGAAAQQLLLDLAESADDAIRGEAVARLAQQLYGARLPALNIQLIRELAGPLADVSCLDGKTGRELAAQWREPPELDPASWPTGKVTWNMGPATAENDVGRIRSPMWGLRWERCDSILGSATALQSARGGELVVADSRGQEFFRSPIDMQNPYRQPGSMYAVSRGNIAVISYGRQMMAISTLPAEGGVGQPVLWRVNLGSSFDFSRPFPEDTSPSAASRPGTYRAPRASTGGRWIGVIGPLTSRGCVFQDQRRLTCVDPLTGAIAWTRNDAPPGSDLWGDAHVVLAAPLGAKKAQAYDMLDGRSLGEFPVPAWRDQVTTVGRSVVRWRSIDDGKFELASYDPMSSPQVQWKHVFAANSRVDVDQQRFVAVASPDGRAVVVDAATGKQLVDAPIDAAPRIEEIHLTVSNDSFMLAVKRPDMARGDRSVRPLTVIDSPVIDGQLYMFDRGTGQMPWNRPVDVVQQALPVNQPVDSPLIMFAGFLSTQDRSGSRGRVSMLVLDKRTGRSLFQTDDLSTSATQCMVRVSDAHKHEAAIEMINRAITFRYTDGRRPPQPPSMAEVETPAGATSGGLLGIFRKLGEGQ